MCHVQGKGTSVLNQSQQIDNLRAYLAVMIALLMFWKRLEAVDGVGKVADKLGEDLSADGGGWATTLCRTSSRTGTAT